MIHRRSALFILLACGLALGCESSTDEPDLFGQAGIRLELPAGTDSLAWIRVGLWHRNATLPPDCPLAGGAVSASTRRATLYLEDEVPVDLCTRMEVTIRKYTGDLVRYVESTPYIRSLSWPWDAKDDQGTPVPSGLYPVFARCLDSRGLFTFRGHYFVWEEGEVGSCEWPLWLERLEPAPAASVLEFYRFPLYAETWTFDDSGRPQATVPFVNPFLVRVEAPGMIPFEAEVNLEADRFSLVRVVWTPAPLEARLQEHGGPRTGLEAR